MPTIGGGQGMDWGLLTALQGKDDWKQKRLDRQADIRYSEELKNIAEKERIAQQEAGDKILNIMAEAQNLKVLDPDMEKIRAKDEELQNKYIFDKLKKYNGDVNLFINSGGLNDLMKYSKEMMNSKEVIGGLRRAGYDAQMRADEKAGLMIRPIYKDVNGSRQKIDPREQRDNFLNGKVDDFEYLGGFKPFTFDYRTHFSKVQGDENGKPKKASRGDVYIAALETAKHEGLNRDDAEYYSNIVADEYEQGVSSGALQPYLYKFDNQTKEALMRSQIDKNKANTNLTNAKTQTEGLKQNAVKSNSQWVQDVNSSDEDVIKFAIGELEKSDGVKQVRYGGMVDGKNIEGDNKEIVITFETKDDKDKIVETTKAYDLSNPKDVAELAKLQRQNDEKGLYLDTRKTYFSSKQKGNKVSTNSTNNKVSDEEYNAYLKSIGL